MTFGTDSGYVGNQKIFIIYGDETAIGDNQYTNNEGKYEFKYLRKGKYKVYTFTKTEQNSLDSAIVQEVEIADKKETVDVPDFKIKTTRN